MGTLAITLLYPDIFSSREGARLPLPLTQRTSAEGSFGCLSPTPKQPQQQRGVLVTTSLDPGDLSSWREYWPPFNLDDLSRPWKDQQPLLPLASVGGQEPC